MTATIEWSYARLDPDARTVADRLSLFERGFTVEAVEAVCEDVPDVLGALAEIAEARLIRRVDSRVEIRFVVLGTVRAYARHRLHQQEDLEDRKVALADHLLSRAREWAGQLDGAEGAAVVGRFDDTAADLNAALDWAADTDRTDLAVEMMTTLTDLWIASGRLVEGLRRTQQLIALAGPTPAQQADLHLTAGKLAYHLTDWNACGRGDARCARGARHPAGDRDCGPLPPRCRAHHDRRGRRRCDSGVGGARGG